MKAKFIHLYMNIAKEVAKMSYAKRRQVGAVLVKHPRVISIGYNGTLPGEPNICEDENNVTLPNVIHAEENCLCHLDTSVENAEGAWLFCTTAPCFKCSELIIKSGVELVVYDETYKNDDGLANLFENGINFVRYGLLAQNVEEFYVDKQTNQKLIKLCNQ